MDQKLKYTRGDVVKIRIQSEVPEPRNVWVEGFVEKANPNDRSYSLSISDFAAFGIDEQLHDVAENLIQPLFLTKDVEFLLAEGYSREEVFLSLDRCNGDLDDALLYLHRHDRLRSEGISEKDSFSLQRSSEMSSNSTSQPSTSTSSIKEFTPSRKQLEQASRTPSVGTSLGVPRISASYRKTSFCDDVRDRGKITMRPKDDEFDFTVVFEKTPLGFEIHPCAKNRNACVGNTLNDFSGDNVYKGSLILDCNDIWLLGQSTVYIQQCIKAEAQTTPVTITFRAKKWMTSARARNLRICLEKSRTKRAKSFSFNQKKVTDEDDEREPPSKLRSKSENYLSPTSCNTPSISQSPKVVRTRLPPSQRRRQLRRTIINPELRLFIIGGKTEFGITHVTATIKKKTISTKEYNPSRTSRFGESLIWERFQQEAESSLTINAMSDQKVIGIGSISIPILPCTIKHSVDLTDHNGSSIGNLSVKVTHIR